MVTSFKMPISTDIEVLPLLSFLRYSASVLRGGATLSSEPSRTKDLTVSNYDVIDNVREHKRKQCLLVYLRVFLTAIGTCLVHEHCILSNHHNKELSVAHDTN